MPATITTAAPATGSGNSGTCLVACVVEGTGVTDAPANWFTEGVGVDVTLGEGVPVGVAVGVGVT
ncbi:MAG: hypothetical protein ACXV3E_01265 [Halobacteriota archaeon]